MVGMTGEIERCRFGPARACARETVTARGGNRDRTCRDGAGDIDIRAGRLTMSHQIDESVFRGYCRRTSSGSRSRRSRRLRRLAVLVGDPTEPGPT